jgi:hypothetical protein
VTIDVERPDMPTSIRAALPSIGSEAQGGSFPVRILTSFADGKVLNVTRSTNVVYASSESHALQSIVCFPLRSSSRMISNVPHLPQCTGIESSRSRSLIIQS